MKESKKVRLEFKYDVDEFKAGQVADVDEKRVSRLTGSGALISDKVIKKQEVKEEVKKEVKKEVKEEVVNKNNKSSKK